MLRKIIVIIVTITVFVSVHAFPGHSGNEAGAYKYTESDDYEYVRGMLPPIGIAIVTSAFWAMASVFIILISNPLGVEYGEGYEINEQPIYIGCLITDLILNAFMYWNYVDPNRMRLSEKYVEGYKLGSVLSFMALLGMCIYYNNSIE